MLSTPGKRFVIGAPLRDRRRAIACAAALLLAACSSSLENAQREAAQAEALLEAGNLPAARAAISKAMSYRDDQLDILLLDARIKYRMQDMSAALDAYRTVLVFDPNNQEALTAAVQVSVMFDDKATAKEMIGRALALNPNNGEVLLSKGVMELRAEEYDAAVATGDQLLADPTDSRGTVLKARALFLKGDKAASYKLLRDAAAAYGNNQLVSAALLENARDEGDVPAMLEQFVFLSSADVTSADLALDEINVRYKSGSLQSARQLGVTYLNKFGTSADEVSRLVDLWEEYDPAPINADDVQALAQSPNLEARLAVVRDFIRHGDLDSGAPLLANSSDPRVFGLMARLQVLRGDRSGLVAAERILQKDPANCEALDAAATWHLNQGAFDKAIIPAQVLATQCRDRIDGYVIMAKAYGRQGRTAAVERTFREGTAAHPQNSILARQFADWLVSRGRGQSAVSLTRRLTVMAPSRPSSWQVRKDICARVGDTVCQAQAEQGLAKARKAYVLDPLPGLKRGDTLFGRTWQ